ncbi:MAG TPA: hypothetical protein VIQ53_02785 [Inquilinus sp.]
MSKLDEAEIGKVQQLAERIADLIEIGEADQPRILLNAVLALYRASAVVAVTSQGICPSCVVSALEGAQAELREDLARNAAPQPHLH